MSVETYFAAAMMNEFISMVEEDLRDLSSRKLSVFWEKAPSVSSEEAASRYDASYAYRMDNDLTLLGEPSFAGQISRGSGQTTFISFLREAGIETEYVEDVSSEEVTTVIPDIQGVMSVVKKLEAKGIMSDPDALTSMFEGLETPITKEEVKHISEEDPTPWAEEDSVAAGKLIQARKYISLYFGGASG